MPLTDSVFAGGYTATVHYSHASRSVVMQATLAGRLDFSETAPVLFYRAWALFTRIIDGGSEIDLLAAPRFGPPVFSADHLTEVHFELITDNCDGGAVINQFDTSSSYAGMPEEVHDFMMISFHHPENGVTAYSHTVKVFAGGRAVGEEEAVTEAITNATRFGLDPGALIMKVTTDAGRGGRPQRLDMQTNELVDAPFRESS